MVWVVNKSPRVINIGGVLVTPLMPNEIDDSFLNHERVKAILDAGDIETTTKPTEDEKAKIAEVIKNVDRTDENKVDITSKYKSRIVKDETKQESK